jgi:hypothetical protein
MPIAQPLCDAFATGRMGLEAVPDLAHLDEKDDPARMASTILRFRGYCAGHPPKYATAWRQGDAAKLA